MKCVQCGSTIQGNYVLGDNGEPYCSPLHRYLAKPTGVPPAVGSNPHPSQSAVPRTSSISRALLFRRIILGVLYSVLFYFVGLFLTGAIVGGIAGVEAGQSGADPAEAGRIAGAQFSQKWAWLFLLLSILVATVGVMKGWFPWTRGRKPA